MLTSRRWILLGASLLMSLGKLGYASPTVLFYHSFDQAVDKPDHALAPVNIAAGKTLRVGTPAVQRQAAWFDTAGSESTLRIDLKDLFPSNSWTVALWEILELKDWLTAPEENLLTLLDTKDRPIIKISKSGGLFVFDEEQVTVLQCFDALYWVRGNREHLSITWDASGSGLTTPKGLLRAYWKARPYASLAIDLDRQPVALEIGQPMGGIGVDEFYVIDKALSLRSLWELMQRQGGGYSAAGANTA